MKQLKNLLSGGVLALVLLVGCLQPSGAYAQDLGAGHAIAADKDADPPRPKPKPGHPEGGDDNFRPARINESKSPEPPHPHPHPGHPEGGDDN